jgi:hypothetical protein
MMSAWAEEGEAVLEAVASAYQKATRRIRVLLSAIREQLTSWIDRMQRQRSQPPPKQGRAFVETLRTLGAQDQKVMEGILAIE